MGGNVQLGCGKIAQYQCGIKANDFSQILQNMLIEHQTCNNIRWKVKEKYKLLINIITYKRSLSHKNAKAVVSITLPSANTRH